MTLLFKNKTDLTTVLKLKRCYEKAISKRQNGASFRQLCRVSTERITPCNKNLVALIFLHNKDHIGQRWSRGHKARGQGQGQGHKKNPRPRPRPRTALPRTEPLEAKDRNARGQGQGPRTQAQVFSKKKVFKNFFQAISNSLAYPEFIGISLNHKSNEMTSSKFFQRGSFCGINLS